MSGAKAILAIVLLSGSHERAHFAFMMASGAAAIGRHVVLFASNEGIRGLLEDWSLLDDSWRDAAVRGRGLAGLSALRDAARELDVRLIACDAGMRAEGFEVSSLWQGVEVAGIATFLEAAAGGQMVSL